MRNEKYIFEEVAIKEKKRAQCWECGRFFYRTEKFFQTINPYNRNEKGEIKSAKEILKELQVMAEEWKPTITDCTEHK